MIDLKQELRKELKKFAIQIGHSFAGAISSNFLGDLGPNYVDVKPLSIENLHIRTGALYRSFVPKSKNNIFKAEITENSIVINIGSSLPYAKIHETGGLIVPKKRKPNFRYAMESFFWAKFYKTGSQYYKNLALKIRKKGFIRIPARKYITKATKKFEKEFLPLLLADFIGILERITKKLMEAKK